MIHRVLVSLVMLAVAAQVSKAESIPESLRSFFAKHCIDCHGNDNIEGDLNLESLSADFADSESAQKWIEVLDRINLGEMPPEDQPRPTEEELAPVVRWVSSELRTNRERMESTGGRVVMRRMTRLEYANTVRDLLGVDFVDGEGPLAKLPPDGAIKGFDRHTRALMIDPSLMDAYLEVASLVADKAIQFRPPIIPQRSVRFEFRDTDRSAMSYIVQSRRAYLEDDHMVLMQDDARTFGVLRHPFDGREIPVTGKYRVRIRAGAEVGADGEPIYMRVTQGAGDVIGQFRVDATPDAMQDYVFEVIRSDALQGEFDVGILPGTQFSSYDGRRGAEARKAKELFESGDVAGSMRIKARMRAQGDFDSGVRGKLNVETVDLSKLPKLHLDFIEVTGPLQAEFPPPKMKRMFPGGVVIDSKVRAEQRRSAELDLVQSMLRYVLPRAFRGRVSERETKQFMELARSELELGSDLEQTLETTLVGILCSPKFLFLHESSSADAATSSTRGLTQLEFATRISFLLWSSQPDDELFRAAVEKKLSDSERLRTQINRMLEDPRSQGFLDGFVRQWFKVDGFNQFPPDERIFPKYYETEFRGLDQDFVNQPLEIVRELIASDGSILDLVDSDWTMLNERLAKFYGINGVEGDWFRRVPLSGRDAAIRGGMLGMAGLHRWGSDGNRTKPVDRGKYILDVFFNDPPPPPPPNAGEVEPNLRGQKLSVRERLSKHREQTTCNHCHRRIDPYGLALENFNTIGRWRELEDGEKPIQQWGEDRPAIDPSGKLMNGTEFNNFVEFKSAMMDQRERFLRGVTEKLLSYALARSIEPNDRLLVDAIVERSAREGYTFRSLLTSIIESKTFRTK
ncbi:MAG: DUF1592 domain-containing protein [Planctomycetota bacterium]